jgi:DNA-binding NarL/FixJ family response regulator
MGIRMLIKSWPGMTLVGEANNRAEAIALTAREKPDVILLDQDLDCRNCGLFILHELMAAASEARILILTSTRDSKSHRCAIRFGAMGLVLKQNAAEELHRAIEKVHAGEIWLSRSLTAKVITGLRRGDDPVQCTVATAKIDSLTSRECKVVSLVGQGLKNKEIANRLSICEITVRHHLTSIYSKLDFSGRLELIIYLYQNKQAGLLVVSPKRPKIQKLKVEGSSKVSEILIRDSS